MMINTDNLDKIFFALADPTRRAILKSLSSRPTAVNNLENPYNISLPAISKHLRVLESAGLITQRKEGNKRWCILKPEPLQEANEWLSTYSAFWDMQLDAFQNYMEGKEWKTDTSEVKAAKTEKSKKARKATRKSTGNKTGKTKKKESKT